MEYKAIAIDLDGTLLDSAKKVSLRNIEALELAAQKGVKIMICSGRNFHEAYRFVEHIKGISYIAACNGATIRDIDAMKLIHETTIDRSAASDAMATLGKYSLLYSVYCGDTVYAERSVMERFSELIKVTEGFQDKYMLVDDLNDLIKSDTIRPHKIYAEGKDGDCIRDLRRELKLIKNIEITSSLPNNIEIMAEGVDKSAAIRFICQMDGIAQNEMIAMGDGENDLPMMNAVGLFVAMGNAQEQVLAKSDTVTRSNDYDGVAAVIEKYII